MGDVPTSRGAFSTERGFAALLAILAVALVAPAPAAMAHPERPSYWPDPGAEKVGGVKAGGAVPDARSLRSAVTGAGPGEVRVVCKGAGGKDSLTRLRHSLDEAILDGYRIRPSQPLTHVSAGDAADLLELNLDFAGMCRYHSVQEAVDDSGNNDRIVIMPGRYTEPRSRKQPTNDPKCDPSMLQETASGETAPSYEYQVKCPNDQNLIHVTGRALVGEALQPPSDDRQGIPEQELGRCIRCNLQIEGSGVKPTDVILDAAKKYEGPVRDPESKPGEYAKDVVLRIDRADGFVGRNFLTRGAREFGFYAEEADGVLLDRVDFFWADDYGHLSFTTDHNVVKNCDGFGAGDAAVYPGAAPETGEQADKSFYTDAPRYNTVIKNCDLRGSDIGYSGSMGNAVRITRNHVYGNVTGITSDTLSAAGHPGFPTDSSLIDHNLIYSNNLDLFGPDTPIVPRTPAPLGTGIVYAGMNDARVHDNWIFDNWRHGVMLFSVPDPITSGGILSCDFPDVSACSLSPHGGAEGNINPGIPCLTTDVGISTSCGNRMYDNHMGRAPQGFKFPSAIDQFGENAYRKTGAVKPNGNDFWWDEFVGNTGNCWYDNVGYDGTGATVTGPSNVGPSLPPDILPSNCGASIGLGDVAKEAYLLDCGLSPTGNGTPLGCDFFERPPKPGTPAAKRAQAKWQRAAARFEASSAGHELARRLAALSG